MSASWRGRAAMRRKVLRLFVALAVLVTTLVAHRHSGAVRASESPDNSDLAGKVITERDCTAERLGASDDDHGGVMRFLHLHVAEVPSPSR